MIKLKARNLHWLEQCPEFDTCVHGSVYLEIDGHVISDGEEDDWTVSGSALLFLRSIDQGHKPSEQGPQLIPHCAMPSFVDNGEMLWFGCGVGIDWQIDIKDDRAVHSFEDGSILETNISEWRETVVRFANQILEFIESEPERQFVESAAEDDKPAFEVYCTELRSLINKHEPSLSSPSSL
ncbi:MAG: hypothetical protein DWQ47_12180 [Acidobacteria bacterium]|nr:MAG: hypothetical protein DWQ32_14595 [Acidobacteriota bacterium]REJ98327.1 MAG: hypothetical protein DWQ38_17395 [Acidobacteriota bacterium]REK17071.1 MAG: hypothetical protein DWQ43_02440 [Acidobacteriota bacterium]REK42981.1 MAG: hypothetical protein DWQ47_12180 [Acidobacteriota bacterium]